VKFPLFIAICLSLSACVTDEANRYYSATKYSPVSVDKVEILTSKPTKKFTVIADFQSRGDTYSSLQKKAAKIGADAIIVTNLGGYVSTESQWAGSDPYRHTASRVFGTAIKYDH